MILQVFSLNPPLQDFPLGGGGFCLEIFDDFTSFLAKPAPTGFSVGWGRVLPGDCSLFYKFSRLTRPYRVFRWVGAGFAWRFLMILQVFSLNPPLQDFPLGGGGFCLEIFDDFTSFLA